MLILIILILDYYTYLVETSMSMNVHAIGTVEVETGGILRE